MLTFGEIRINIETEVSNITAKYIFWMFFFPLI